MCTGQERDIESFRILHFFTSKYMSLIFFYCITRTWQKTDQKKRTDSYTELELFTHFISFVSTSLRSRWPFLSNLEQVRCCLNMDHNCFKWKKPHLVHHDYIYHPPNDLWINSKRKYSILWVSTVKQDLLVILEVTWVYIKTVTSCWLFLQVFKRAGTFWLHSSFVRATISNLKLDYIICYFCFCISI